MFNVLVARTLWPTETPVNVQSFGAKQELIGLSKLLSMFNYGGKQELNDLRKLMSMFNSCKNYSRPSIQETTLQLQTVHECERRRTYPTWMNGIVYILKPKKN